MNDLEAMLKSIPEEKVKMIEESVARKEKLFKVKPGTIKEENNINDMLINAIEAKIAILNDI